MIFPTFFGVFATFFGGGGHGKNAKKKPVRSAPEPLSPTFAIEVDRRHRQLVAPDTPRAPSGGDVGYPRLLGCGCCGYGSNHAKNP